jgi:SAM-dependent methyltransferase
LQSFQTARIEPPTTVSGSAIVLQRFNPGQIRQEKRMKFNTVLSLEHFDNPSLRTLTREIFTHSVAADPAFPRSNRCAKVWENALCVRGLREFGAIHEEAEILGIGAGEEITSFYLTRHVRRVFATDIYADAKVWAETASRDMLASPETSVPVGYPWNPKRLVVQHMDALSLRYEDNSFDGIFSSGSIEHFGTLDDITLAAQEMGRVLKPRGILTLATEFRIEGPADGVGIPGAVIFSPEMLLKTIVQPSGLELVDEPHFVTTPATRRLAYPLLEALSKRIRDPSVALEHDGYVWTSVVLCLRKPAAGAIRAARSALTEALRRLRYR